MTFRQQAQLKAKIAQRKWVDSSSVEVSSNGPASDDALHNLDVVGLGQDGLNQVNSRKGGSGNEAQIKRVHAAVTQVVVVQVLPRDFNHTSGGGFYKVPCGDCTKVYIGETGRDF